MRKNKKNNEIVKLSENEVKTLQDNYLVELESNPEYSLYADPTNKYNMTEEQKNFIIQYVQFKSIGTAMELSGLQPEEAKKFFVSYNTQQEIRRINRALYLRQFHNKLLDLDQIGGWLSSLLTDENVPIGDQLKTPDKLKVANMIIDLFKLKQESMQNPQELMKKDLSIQIKNLSVTTIQQLLKSSEKDNNNAVVTNANLSAEEKEYLNTLPTEQLLEILEETNKEGDNHE